MYLLVKRQPEMNHLPSSGQVASDLRIDKSDIAIVDRTSSLDEKSKQYMSPSLISAESIFERGEDEFALEGLLVFEPEEDAERFFLKSSGVLTKGTFVVSTNGISRGFHEDFVDWAIDFLPVIITGDGISSEAEIVGDLGGEQDFLKVRNGGRKSIKRTEVPSGTRLSIDPVVCRYWVEDILKKRQLNFDNIETLISYCEGNCDPEDLRINLFRILETVDIELASEATECGGVTWDINSDVSSDDLAIAIEATFSRMTHLPGTGRFEMDKSSETRLLDRMVREKQELLLGILACEAAVKYILNVVDDLFHGLADAEFVTMRTIVFSQPDHKETVEFLRAAEVLKAWSINGRILDGKRRRAAFQALEELDLTLMFHRKIVETLAKENRSLDESTKLDCLILVFESTVEQLITKHLPYARRFASRNVEDGEVCLGVQF
jgi:RNA polymerase primary sigma factor